MSGPDRISERVRDYLTPPPPKSAGPELVSTLAITGVFPQTCGVPFVDGQPCAYYSHSVTQMLTHAEVSHPRLQVIYRCAQPNHACGNPEFPTWGDLLEHDRRMGHLTREQTLAELASDLFRRHAVADDRSMRVVKFADIPGINQAERFALANSKSEQLARWWLDQANREVHATVPKSVEYGSQDLVEIGRDLARVAGRTVTDQDAAELGVYFYLRGKLARWTEAVVEGRQVSDDTLFDIGVYVRMAQRIRETGGWPGV